MQLATTSSNSAEDMQGLVLAICQHIRFVNTAADCELRNVNFYMQLTVALA
jgi:hypothetical protein